MLKKSLKILSIAILIVAISVPTYITLVSSATGYIRINSTTDSPSDISIAAGDNVSLYFGDVTWDGTEMYLLMSLDSNTQPSTGDVIYSPVLSVSNITNQTQTYVYNTGMGDWIVGNNWINGSTAPNIPAGDYYIKAFDSIGADVAVTDVSIEVYNVVNGTLDIFPPSGPGGINVTLSGGGYTESTSVSIDYYDSELGQWNFLGTTMSNATGYINFTTEIPDLKKSLRAGDNPETYAQVSYRAKIASTIYGYADYNQYSRGLKTVDTLTATGLYGNGSDFVYTVVVEAGDNITLSGKWFNPGAIYVRWDGHDIFGTVTSSEWDSATIIGTSVANQTGYFETTVQIPAASAGEHYLAIEDYETRVMIKIYLDFATLDISPSSGPGGIDVTFTGSGYQASDEIDLYYYDSILESWNFFATTNTNETGHLTFNTTMPDLKQAIWWPGDSSEYTTILSFRVENSTTVYAYADHHQYLRGIKSIGSKTANGLYGNGTDLSSSIIVEEGDNLTLSGKWFHPSDAIYVRWDGSAIVGTVTSSEWASAQIIGTSIANANGYFETTITIPEADEGVHFLSIEDSQTFVILQVYFDVYTPPSSPPPSSPPPPAKYDLTIDSLPVSGVSFTVGSESKATPYTENLQTGSYTIEMPQTHVVGSVEYVFQNWTDGVQTRSRTITLSSNMNLTATYSVAPVAEFTFNPQTPIIGESVSFDASSSSDSDGTIVSYFWDFGDNNNATTANPVTTHSFDSTGTYQVELTVTDNTGLTATVSHNITAKIPSQITISTSSSSTSVGFEVQITGVLQDGYGTAIEYETVVLQYAFEGTSTWTMLTSDLTNSNGEYSAVWIPPATGDFIIKAQWDGNATHLKATDSTTISSITYDGEYVFSVESNSTISNLQFNSTDQTLSFTAQGTSGTQGYAKVVIDKSLVTDIELLTVYLDDDLIEYTVEENNDSWCITINYKHSTHKITVSLDATLIPEFSSIVLITLFVTATIAAITYKKKLHKNS